MRAGWAAVIVSAAVVGVAAGILLRGGSGGPSSADAARIRVPALHGTVTWPAGARPAPAIRLRDQRGSLVSLASLRGAPILLLFLDSHCRQACPIEGRLAAAAIRRLPQGLRARLVVVSVDPKGDTPASIAAAAAHWRLPAGFEWLNGSAAALRRVWHAYDITVDPRSGDVVHSTALYVIGPSGYERAGFLLPFAPAFVADDLRALARGAV
ncbi:MAG TPA: SCO family protein [Gaiellaceae bacterium]